MDVPSPPFSPATFSFPFSFHSRGGQDAARVPAGRRLRRLVNPSNAEFLRVSSSIRGGREGCEERIFEDEDRTVEQGKNGVFCFAFRKESFMQEFMDLFIFHPSGWNMYNSLRTSNIGFIYLFFEVELILGGVILCRSRYCGDE